MNISNRTLSTYLMATVLGTLCVSLPTAARAASGLTKADIAKLQRDGRKFHAWMDAPWVNQDKPFQLLRTAIDREITSSNTPLKVVQKYQKEKENAPHSATAQFAYYYALYQTLTLPHGYNLVPTSAVATFLTVIVQNDFPPTYNLTRLVFLCQMRSYADPLFKGLAWRLYKHDPKDYIVKYNLATLLSTSKDSNERRQALLLNQQLVKDYPTVAQVYGGLGGTYYEAWRHTQDPRDAEAATTNLQRWLEMAPADHPYRPLIQSAIDKMKNAK